jgi:hypothetical protein
MATEKQCSKCIFWNAEAKQQDALGQDIATCHINPPQVVEIDMPQQVPVAKGGKLIAVSKRGEDDVVLQVQQVPIGAFPVIRGTQWCARFMPRNGSAQ